MSGGGHNPCADCGACCRSYIVPVYGHDIWRICTYQALAPHQFLVACPQPKQGGDGFKLSAYGPAYGLALDKQGRFHPRSPCVFLMRLAGGERCGIYADRPVACRAYPMGLWSGVVFQRRGSLCPPESWPLPEVVRPGWRRALEQARMHFDVYQAVVSRWNARVAAAPAGRQFDLLEYYDYVFNVYEDLGVIDVQYGEHALDRVRVSWPGALRQTVSLRELCLTEREAPWAAYYERSMAIIERFFPDAGREQRLRRAAPAEV